MGKAFGQVNIAETLSLMGDELANHWDRIVGMGLFWAWLQVVLSVPAFAPGSNPFAFIEGFDRKMPFGPLRLRSLLSPCSACVAPRGNSIKPLLASPYKRCRVACRSLELSL